MEDKIQNKNRIPGCDRLTQPYEIKALSKYLKSIKKVQEDNLVLGKDNLEMSPTGPIQIEELPGESIGLENYLDNIESLPDASLKIEDTRNLESLPSESLGLGDVPPEYTELPQEKLSLELEETELELDNTRLDLENEEELVLQEGSLQRPGEDLDVELSDNLQRMVGNILEKTTLETNVERIQDRKPDPDLTDDIIRLSGTDRDIIPQSPIEKLDDTERDIELSSNIEKLSTVEKITGLENSIATLSDIKEVTSLEDEVKEIDVPEVIGLKNTKEKVPGKIDDPKLKESKEKISDNRKPELENTKEKISGKVKEVSKLEKSKEKISDNRKPALEKEKALKLSGDRKDLKLEKTQETIPEPKEEVSKLEETLLKVTDEYLRDPVLEDKLYTLDDDDVLFDPELPTESINLYELEGVIPDQNSLPDSKIAIEGTIEEPKLSDYKEKIEVKEENRLENYEDNIPNVTEGFGNRPVYSKFLDDPKEFVIKRPFRDISKLQDNPEDQDEVYNSNKDFKSLRAEEGIQDIRDVPDDFKERLSYTIEQLKKEGDWGKRILAYLNVIANRSDKFTEDISQADLERFESLVAKTVSSNSKLSSKVKQYMPAYALPHFSLETLNPSAWLRALAEGLVGLAKNIHGKAKALLVDEALGLLILGREELEELTEASKFRLPGDASPFSAVVSGGSITSAVGNTVGALAGTPLQTPSNRPMKDGRNPYPKPDKDLRKALKETPGDFDQETKWEDVLGRTGKADKIVAKKAAQEAEGNKKTALGKTLQKVGNAIGGKKKEGDYSFNEYYIQNSKGLTKTIEELVGGKVEVKSVENFFHNLETSPYLTTQSKVTGTTNQYKVSTLDSNSYWEVKLYPFLGEENGYATFLPDYAEINENNKKLFGIDTEYSQWIPITSFELQKKKLTQKTLGLYDGEISYPVSMEFLNEFRITIIDDAYKSWKTYFQKCAEVSVFCSKARVGEEVELIYPTILQDEYLVAMYKNITFRCELYVMTPQLATVIKYDLLLVMKDFMEEYYGEGADSAAIDLTISFSIVGENPIGDTSKPEPVELTPQVTSKRGTDYATITTQALNKGLGLLK